eukprot:TRINITY_DN173_c0_g1_i2.p1 TRINITY_DN173_c0_g1~~TRINITY_DN173_c0_g1_i2.p1  ORF type:complete len:1033 (+),score=317.78 TRINITY_DN173_c0_g1_i2:35-3133(+)
MTAMEVDGQETAFDEQLYNRQTYAIGAEAQTRLSRTDVLICGMTGLGMEIAKNIILTGVRSVTLHDTSSVEWNDLSAAFYYAKENIGANKVDSCIAQLQELNKYCSVTKLPKEDLKPEDLLEWRAASLEKHPESHQVVVYVDKPTTHLKNMNETCRNSGIKFVAAESRGVSGCIFVDNGPAHIVYDTDGEEIRTLLVINIGKEVTVHEDERHELSDGDTVMFTDLQEFPALHNDSFDVANPITFEVVVTGPYSFKLRKNGEDVDTSKLGYVRGGYVKRIRQPVTMPFKSLEHSIREPEFLNLDFAKMDTPGCMHLLFLALHEFERIHGHLPAPHDPDHADEVVNLAAEQHKKFPDLSLDRDLVRELAAVSKGNLGPMAAMLGGLAAHEVLKASSGKFTPIKQWFYYEARECLLSPSPSAECCQPQNSRYDGLIAIFGKAFQEKLHNSKVFVVGSGALGCEFLKNYAMLGVGCGDEGSVVVTDMDGIEKSNLSRQFLFRPKDIGELKSKCAAEAARVMNPDMNITYLTEKVAPTTEHIFDDAFWESLDCVTNALDNVIARQYVDSKCVGHRKPLLESGTLGSKGNVQVVVPYVTESYGSSHDPPEKSIPICTLKNFPNAIEHTIQWARDSFEGFFSQVPREVNGYVHDKGFLVQLDKEPSSRITTLQAIRGALVTEKPKTYEDCVKWARIRFDALFSNEIKTLLHNFPLDTITNSGEPFWSGAKRPPQPLEFDPSDEMHALFVEATAAMFASLYSITISMNPEETVKFAAACPPLPWVPKKVKIQTEENEKVTAVVDDSISHEEIIALLPKPETLSSFKMVEVEFEKDDDTNHHMDFVTACSNLRARNYKIPEADKNKTKGIAGKIIPAMVTTTALVTGLVNLEFLKVMQQNKKLEDFNNSFLNLAIPFLIASDPATPAEVKYGPADKPKTWTLWDRFDVDEGRDITLQEFIDWFEEKHELEISMISAGTSVIYTFFQKQSEKRERLKTKVSQLVERISKKPIPANMKYLPIEVCADYDGESADVPSVRYKFR